MEELGENVVFRQVDQFASYEVDAFLAYLLGNPIKPLGINEKFSPLLGYLAPAYELSGTEAVAPHITHLLHTSIHPIDVTPLLRMLGENSPPPFPGRYPIASASLPCREIAGKCIQRSRRLDMDGITRQLVLQYVQTSLR